MATFTAHQEKEAQYRPLDQFGQITDILFNAISVAGIKLRKGKAQEVAGVQQNALSALRSLRTEREAMGESVASIDLAIPLAESADWSSGESLVNLTAAIMSLSKEA